MNKVKIILILVLFCLTQQVASHQCNHKANYNIAVLEIPDQLEQQDESDRNLADAMFRMTYDSTDIDTKVTNPDQLKLVKKTLEIAKLFYTNLMVPKKPTLVKIKPTLEACSDYTFSNAQKTTEIESDFHFFIQAVNKEKETWIAQSQACQVQQGDNRTTMGVITINLNYLSKMTTSNYDFQNYVDVFIHEMFHSLIFSPALFQYYQKSPNVKYTADVDYKISDPNQKFFVAFPNCINWAKEYYGCNTITSFPLENDGTEGSAGAHWERTVLLNDIMTASSLQGDNYWSGLNNALILDSGWYTLRTDQAPFKLEDKTMWGRGKGCDFFDNRCTKKSYSEFCVGTENDYMNTYSYSGLGYCSKGDKYSQCSYVTPFKNQLCVNENNKYDEALGAPLYSKYNAVFDATTRSFKSNLSPIVPNLPGTYEVLREYFAICYPFTCSSDNLKVTVTVGDTDLLCDQDGKIFSNVDGFNGSMTCPNPIKEFCDGVQSCPEFCGQRGYCIQGKCRCISGITGLNQTNCECETGFFVENNACVTCGVENCKTCNKAGTCSECILGYYNKDGKCQKCGPKCIDCGTNGNCLKCQKGYIKYSDTPEECSLVPSSSLILKAFASLSLILFIMLI